MNVIIQVLLRHGLSAIGFSGVLSDDDAKQIAGALVVLGMAAWSLWQKRDQIRSVK